MQNFWYASKHSSDCSPKYSKFACPVKLGESSCIFGYGRDLDPDCSPRHQQPARVSARESKSSANRTTSSIFQGPQVLDTPTKVSALTVTEEHIMASKVHNTHVTTKPTGNLVRLLLQSRVQLLILRACTSIQTCLKQPTLPEQHYCSLDW